MELKCKISRALHASYNLKTLSFALIGNGAYILRKSAACPSNRNPCRLVPAARQPPVARQPPRAGRAAPPRATRSPTRSPSRVVRERAGWRSGPRLGDWTIGRRGRMARLGGAVGQRLSWRRGYRRLGSGPTACNLIRTLSEQSHLAVTNVQGSHF